MKIRTITFLFIFISFISKSLYGQVPELIISDHNNTTGTITIDCDYNFIPPKKVRLTATFPDLKSTTEYTVESVPFNQTGSFADGTPIVFSGDDTWSSTIPMGFTFCFYNNNYNSVTVGDNGIVRFGYDSSVPEGAFSSIINTTPNPSLVRNAIFGGFQDMLNIPAGFGCATGENCGTVTYLTTGTAPFRKFIVNFNAVNHFNCYGTNTRKSTFQIILNETTNIVEVNVKDKPLTCTGNISANGNGNSLIGLNNSNGTKGIAPPQRNTGTWAAQNESYQFLPSGASSTTLSWYNAAGSYLGNANPIEIIPPNYSTFYNAKVLYNTCSPVTMENTIVINYDLDYPVAPDISANFCDTANPFPDEIVDIAGLLPAEAGIIKTIHNTQAEADANANALPGMDTFHMTTTTRTFYYRVTKGSCYATGKITVKLFQTPQIADQEIRICDTNNDGTEPVSLPGLTSQISGYLPGMTVSYYHNLPNANAGINPVTSITVNNPPGFYDVYIRVVNANNPSCFTVRKITLRIMPKLELAPITPFCINDPNFDLHELFDLTSIPVTIITGPANTNALTIQYYTSLYNAQNGISPIANPNNYLVSIPSPHTETTLYMTINASGYCSTIVPATIRFCEAMGGGGSGGGGGGGTGGGGDFGACLETGEPIPSYDLNVVYNSTMSAIVPLPVPLGFYTTLNGAQTEDPATALTSTQISSFFPVVPLSAVWVRYVDVNGVVGIIKLVIPVKFIKHVNQDYTICDLLNDGHETVNLLPYITQIQLENPGETVSCFANITDYNAGTNPITSITVSSPNTIVYVKVKSYNCSSNYDLNFILTPFNIGTPVNRQVCDIGADGTELYDLTTMIPGLTSGFNSPLVSFHTTSAGAFNQTNLINSPANYPINPMTVVWVRIEEDPATAPNECPTIQQVNFGFFNSVATNPIGVVEICDTDNDGQVLFDNLNQVIASVIIENPLEPIIKKLYTSLTAAQNNDPVYEILPDWDTFVYDTSILGVTGSIYLYLKNTVTGCERIVPINVAILSFPLTVNSVVTTCDFENDNSETIADMAVFNAQITSNYLLYTYQYFGNMADALAGAPEIPADFTIQHNDTIYVKITNGTNAACARIVPVAIQLIPAPVVTPVTAVICDNLGDGSEAVNLNSYQDQLISNPANTSFTFYNLYSDALQELNPIPNLSTTNFTVSSFDANNFSPPVFVRVTNTITHCFAITTIVFQRRYLIIANDTIQSACDISVTNELSGIFNLPASIPDMITNPSGYTISFHNTPANAATGANPIATPDIYPVTASQTSFVYVRFEDLATSCYTVKTLELQIYNLPKFVNSTYDVCDDNLDGLYTIDLTLLNATVVENPLPYSFQYFLNAADAASNSNAITNITNYTINPNDFPEIIYVKGTNSNNCSKTKTVTLEHKPEVPLLTDTVILTECDTDNNGIEAFDLTTAEGLITAQPGIQFQYFSAIADLQSNTNPIANPGAYPNPLPNSNPVYVRLSAPNTHCDNWATITLNPFYEEYSLPNPITLCDNNADGTEQVDLTQTIYDLLPAYDPAALALEFYLSSSDANAGTNSIADPQHYIFSNFATPLFVKIRNIATGCSLIKELHFINPPAIILTPQTISRCDFDRNGTEVISISDYYNLLHSNPSGYTISCYASEAGANAALIADQLSATAYLLTQPQQTIWVRFEDSHGCFSVTSLTAHIIPLPNPNTHPVPLESCDDNNPGDLKEVFDLTTNAAYVLNGSTDLITYHLTESDAIDGSNSIVNPTSHETTTASIWIRVTTNPVSTLTDCAVIIEQKLIVHPLPAAGSISDYYSCINTNDGKATFTLHTKDEAALAGQNPNTFTVNYHLAESDAALAVNPLPAIFISTSRLLWVSIQNNLTGCISTTTLQLIAETSPTATKPPVHATTVCDTDGTNNGHTVFDLTALDPVILGPYQANNPDYSIHYYSDLANLNANIPISNPAAFENESNPQIIYVRVIHENTVGKCAAETSFNIKVNRLPEPVPNGGFVCYNPVTGAVLSSHIIHSGLSATTHTFEWYNGTVLIPGQTGTALEVTQPGHYFVVATHTATGCESVPAEAVVGHSEPAIATARVEYSFNDIINIIIHATGAGNYSYQLNEEPIQASPVFENVAAGTHTLLVHDNNGCNPTRIEVVVLDYDKFFTPNGDGYNDTWHIAGIKGQPNAKVYIFDRYGKFLKQLFPGGKGWDGTYNGAPLPSTDYWFSVKYIENGEEKEFRSHFAMKR
ncbi:T9SS type B sorting domain-containing protein [Flavobacterium sp. UBA4197]|uniref:T9SS type B sorting domain-containing protein n=1 Tax=Flavobacterium sp. UBA4197 TaxID=1946546 RepID=UPI00257FDA7B|nr:T9SS type B sorting domain-containing protein [Flavobacterium sp. UBA4197]